MNEPRRRYRGFTVLELMIALLIGSMLVASSVRILNGAADGLDTIRSARGTLDQESNARRWLGLLAFSIEVGQARSLPFDGTRERLRCTAYVQTARGWQVPVEVTVLRVENRIIAITSWGTVPLFFGVRDLQFEYLTQREPLGAWVGSYRSPVSAPVAIRLRLTREGAGVDAAGGQTDTLVLMLGERG